MKNFVTSLFVLSSLVGFSTVAQAQPYPMDSMPLYSEYREELFRNGWRLGEGKTPFSYPEMSCGNRVCTANWIAPDNTYLSFTLWISRGSREGYIVSPAELGGSLTSDATRLKLPTTSLPSYLRYRRELINKGWLPVFQANGAREFPEVVCLLNGKVCVAHWRNSRPAIVTKLEFVLWNLPQGLKVAPYIVYEHR